ncbi:MAG: tetratricopeptide repeat protein [Thermomicrobiaceae bacterium]
MSVLTVAFAIAMAFFLVIGAVAVGITEFIGGNGNEPISQQEQEPPDPVQQESEEEEQELRDRIDEDPEDYSAHGQLAVLLANTGRVDEAISHYETALEDDPDDVELRMSFAQSLRQGGYGLDAEVQLERVLEVDGDNAQAMFLLGEIKQNSDPPQREEAEELFEQVIETDPDSFYAEQAEAYLAGPDEAEDESEIEIAPDGEDEPDEE